jgi:hypothetical protein
VYAISATVTISDSHIYSNTASQGFSASGGVGGGLLIWNSEFNMVHNQILSNIALISHGFAFGGGLAIACSSGRLEDNLIAGNAAAGTAHGNGGGVIIDAGRDDLIIHQQNSRQPHGRHTRHGRQHGRSGWRAMVRNPDRGEQGAFGSGHHHRASDRRPAVRRRWLSHYGRLGRHRAGRADASAGGYRQ